MVINTSGNVGIGTTSPANKLDVVGDGIRTSADQSTSAFLVLSGTSTEGRITVSSYGSYQPMTFYTGGSERVRITSVGNVGIGTTSPYGRLELNGSGQTWPTAPAIRMWDSFNSKGWLVGSANNYTAGDFYIRTLPSVSGDPGAGQQEFTIKHATGNVGIGTSSPSQKLDVIGTLKVGNSGISNGDVDLWSNSTGIHSGSSLTWRMNTGGGNPNSAIARIQPDVYNASRGYINALDFYVGDWNNNNNVGNALMSIMTTGNVGIGTTNPNNLLNTFIANGAGEFSRGIRISTGNGTYTTGHGGMLEFQNEDVMTAGIRGVRGSGWGSSLLFYVHNASAGNTFNSTFVERMRINEDGNVGIGTTSPSGKLSIVTSGTNDLLYLNSGVNTDFAYKIVSGSDDAFVLRRQHTTQGDLSIMSWTYSGKVGIGTTSPVTKLQVVGGSISIDADQPIRKAGDNSIIGYSSTLPGINIGSGAATDMVVFNAGGVERVRINTSGNVGIGTTSPSAMLDIYHATNGYASVGLQGYSTAAKWFLTSGISGDTIQDFSISHNNDGTSPVFRLSNSTGAATFSSTVAATGATFTGAGSSILIVRSTSASGYATTDYFNSSNSQVASFGYGNASVGAAPVQNAAYIYTAPGIDFVGYMGGGERLRIASTGAATFSSSVNATTIGAGSGTNQAYLGAGFLGFYNAASSAKYIKLTDDASTIDAIGFSKSGSASTTWFPSGNVGIGTTSPAAKLDVQTSSTNLSLRLGNTNGTNWDFYSYNDTNLYINNTLGTKLTILNNNGNVGIGTNSPATKFHVHGYTNIDSVDVVATFSSDNTAKRVNIGYSTSGDYGFINAVHTGVAWKNLIFGVNGGNIGIGITNPAYKLDVYGDARFGDGNNFNPLIQFAGSGRVAASPGYSFVGDLDTGMFNPNLGNTLAFSTAGAERMRIDSAGNVGIGTTSPLSELHVQGTSTEQILISYDSTKRMLMGRASGYGWISPYTNGVSYDNLVLVRDGGNVGIGTTSPSEKLAVAGRITLSGSEFSFSGDEDKNITVFSNRLLNLRTNDITRLTITGSGNVGIGTTSPGYKLDVNGDGRFSGRLTMSTGGYVVTNNDIVWGNISGNYIGQYYNGTDLHFYNGTGGANFFSITRSTGVATFSSSVTATQYNISNSNQTISIANTSDIQINAAAAGSNILFRAAGDERMRITASGNVGIGTTSPVAKLQVDSGDIYASVVVARVLLGPQGSTGDASFGSSGIGAPSVGAQDYGFYASHNAYRTSTGAWRHSRTSTIPAVRLLGSGGVSSGNEGFSFDYSPNVGTADINWTNLMKILPSGNVGIGTSSPTTKLEVVPSVSNSSIRTGGLEMQSYAVNNSWYAENLYFNGASWRLRDTGFATQMYMQDGTIDFNRVATGAAGSAATLLTTMRLAANGNIGIGTTSPGAKLEVSDFGGATIKISNKTDGGQTTGDLVGALDYYSYDADYPRTMAYVRSYVTEQFGRAADLRFATTATSAVAAEAMRITSGGNVGIGTTSPGAKLDVITSVFSYAASPLKGTGMNLVGAAGTGVGGGDGAASGVLNIIDNAAMGANNGGTITLGGNYIASGNAYSLTYAGIKGGKENGTDYNSAGYLALYTTPSGVSPAERMRIDASGNVGIGTTNPADKLDVSGEVVFGPNAERLSLGSQSIGFNRRVATGAIYSATGFAYQFQHTGNTTNTSDYLALQVYNTAGTQITPSALVVNGLGNVGIGTTTPSDKLQVIASTYNGITITTPDVATFKMRSSSGVTTSWGFATTNLAASDFGIYQSNSGGGDPINAGTARLYFNGNNGNVGIGTTSPSEKLDVNGNLKLNSSTPYISLNSTYWGNPAYIQSGINLAGNAVGDYLAFQNLVGKGMAFQRGATTDLLISTAGNILINTTSDTGLYKLDVNGTGRFSGTLRSNDHEIKNSANSETLDLFLSPSVFSAFIDYPTSRDLIFRNKTSGTALTLASTGAATFSSSVTAGSQLSILGSDGGGKKLYFTGGTTKYNFMIAAQDNVNNALEITPSSAAGGSTFSTPAVVINSSGNVGIGTTSPTEKLHIVGSNALQIIQSTTAGQNSTLKFITTARTWGIGANMGLSNSNFEIYDYTASANRLVIDSAGNVGIGTTSPSGKLAIKSPGEVSSYGDGFVFQRNANTAKLVRIYESSADGFLEVRTGNDSIVSKLSGYSGTPSYFLSNVGIGTSSPTQTLTIQKSGYPIIDFYDGATGRGDIGYNTGTTSFNVSAYSSTPLAIYTNGAERMRITSGGTLQLNAQATYGSMTYEPSLTYTRSGQTGVGGIYFGNSYNSNNNVAMQLRVSNDGTQVQAMTISSGGNVGIGTTSPSYNLHVEGNTSGISIYASHDIAAFSDITVKKEVKKIENAIEKVKELNGYTYVRTDDETGTRRAGVIAQEVQKVLPEVVSANPDGTLNVAYSNMIALLIEGMKEQQATIERLENRIKQLEK
jgi:hypothetical protein